MSFAEKLKANQVYENDTLTPDLSVLRNGRRKPPLCPMEVFGTSWSDWLLAAAEGAGAPVDYTAGALLSAGAALIGNSRRVCVWEGWIEPSALWIGIVGDPSSGKSPGTDPVLDLIRHIERDASKDFEQVLRIWETESQAARCAKDKWKENVAKAVAESRDAPNMPDDAVAAPEPSRPRIIVNDSSIEKLGQILGTNEKGLLMHRDELIGIFGSFGRYSNNDGGERTFYIESYGGRSYTIDRVKHATPIQIRHLLMSILGGTQPDRLHDLCTDADDGLVARFNWIWPEPIPPHRPRGTVDSEAALNAFQRLASLSLSIAQDGNYPRIIYLTDDAKTFFQSWRETHYNASHDLVGILASSYGKAPGHLLRLALNLEYMWWAISPEVPEPSMVSKKAITAAAHLIESYFKPMAERVFGDVSVPEDERLAATLSRWLAKQKQEKPVKINLRTLRRESRLPGLRIADKVKVAANALVDAHWLFPLSETHGAGRPREDYIINPNLWGVLP